MMKRLAGASSGILFWLFFSNAVAADTGTRLNTFHDGSGKITVSVFGARSGTQQQHWTDYAVSIDDPDMVVIGGGGMAVETPAGALLTASYPKGDWSTWLVSSKDHGIANPHYLTAYAIGLKIDGMTRDQLVEALEVKSDHSSSIEPHPLADVDVDANDYLLLGGGFNILFNGAGNFATGSIPITAYTWMAASKDHGIPDPAILHVVAIGIKQHLPVGDLKSISHCNSSVKAPHPRSTASLPLPGYAMTGGGAWVHWKEPGNLIWMLQPTTTTAEQSFTAASEDISPSPATITTCILGIQLTPKR